MYERYFKLPEDASSERLLRLLWSIPQSWCFVDGFLKAPQSLVGKDDVAIHTGYEVNRFLNSEPSITGTKGHIPDCYALVVERKYPEFIVFDTVGDNAELFEKGMRLAHGFVSLGYRGWLSFYRDYMDNSKYDNSARCHINLRPWSGAPMMGNEAGPQPPRVLAEWHERYGEEDHVAPIVLTCQELGLEEYEPSANREVA